MLAKTYENTLALQYITNNNHKVINVPTHEAFYGSKKSGSIKVLVPLLYIATHRREDMADCKSMQLMNTIIMIIYPQQHFP